MDPNSNGPRVVEGAPMTNAKTGGMSAKATKFLLGLAAITAILIAREGCSHSARQIAPPEPPLVPVSSPVIRDITDHVDFTGRTDAVEAVDIRPRVTGYLVKMPFKEGAEIKAG